MTPKEKANELFLKHWKITIDNKQSKQCALIAVDEILIECRLERDWYWNEIKQEILKL
jgi:hypothetical protein